MDNYSKYDNFSQYSSPSFGERRYGEEESLLQLLKKDLDTKPNCNVPHGQPHSRDNQSRLPEDHGEESLLGLLNGGQVEIDRGGQPRHAGREEESLLDLLNNETGMDYKPSSNFTENGENGIHRGSQPTDDSGDESLFRLLNGVATNENAPFTYPTTNGQHDTLQYPQPFEAEEHNEESLVGLLNEESTRHSTDKYKELRRLQLQLEIESTEEAVMKCLSTWNSARDRSDHTTIPAIRKVVTSWYGSLTEAIELEQWLYLNGDNKTSSSSQLDTQSGEAGGESTNSNGLQKTDVARDRTIYGPLLCLLPPQKTAILLAHTALSCSVAGGELGSKVVSLAIYIAQALETEVNVSRALRVRASQRKWKMNNLEDEGDEVDGVVQMSTKPPNGSDSLSDNITVDKWVYTATHLKRFLDELSGNGATSGDQKPLKGQGRLRPALVRKRCQDILLAEGFMGEGDDDGTTAPKRPISLTDFAEWDPVLKVKLGAALIRLLLEHTSFSKRRGSSPEPAFFYSRKKTGEMKFNGFVTIHPELLKIAMKEELSHDSSFISPRYMQNTRCQPMVVPPKDWKAVDDGGYETIKTEFMRTRHCKTQKVSHCCHFYYASFFLRPQFLFTFLYLSIKDAIRHADLTQVFEGLNVLGRIPWKINQNVLDAACKCWDDGIALGDIPSQDNHQVPPLPTPLDYRDFNLLDDDEKKVQVDAFRIYKDAITKHFRFKQKNMDLHSLRCSAMLKLNQAKKFRDFEEIFFPYNVDFRGRAYPVPPHLSIVGSDLCRALLMFAHPKPLGPNGLYWLKVHLANLAG